ncbi:prolipoprotein diacylglyceryl transferase [Acidobacterium sp. S8]|uniref:prolipoprotein diacylglyceryl transferase n=1 Tax=Acidobacterium sp. S8 TaxID=1641854 RepID=UPI00131E5D7C|nr:prolipoprotein diacylglyceryl transferase family protein [Acidobacterium sp. S8]
MYPRLFQFGHVAIPTYGVFAAIALVAALVLASDTARRLNLDPNKIWNLSLLGIFTALLGSRLLLALFHLQDFLAHPFWILGLVTIRSHGVFYGGVLMAALVCLVYMLSAGLPILRTLDCVVPAAALFLAIHSLGAFLAGSDYGVSTIKPWGVIYRHRLATLWSGTPIGVRLHPVQIYEALFLSLLFVFLLVWLPRRRQDGDLAGGFFFVYGVMLFFLDFYRGDRTFLFGGAISSAQLLATGLILVGGALWLGRKPTLASPASMQI